MNHEILKGDRAEYGKQILAALSQELTAEYGKGLNCSVLNMNSPSCSFFAQAGNCLYTVETIGTGLWQRFFC